MWKISIGTRKLKLSSETNVLRWLLQKENQPLDLINNIEKRVKVMKVNL